MIVAPPYSAILERLNGWRVNDVPPRAPAHHVGDHMVFRPHPLSNGLNRRASGQVQTPNFADSLFSQSLVPNLRALGLGVPAAIGRIARRWTVALSLDCVTHVVLRRSPPQMARIAARRVVARVQRVCALKWGCPMGDEAHDPRGHDITALVWRDPNIQNSIAGLKPRFCVPWPAFVFPPAVNFRPEARNIAFVQNKHEVAISGDRGIVKW